MKVMSWSRYRSLSWSFMRIHSNMRCSGLKRAGHTVTTTVIPDPTATNAVGQRRHRPSVADCDGAARRASPGVSGSSVSNS